MDVCVKSTLSVNTVLGYTLVMIGAYHYITIQISFNSAASINLRRHKNNASSK